MQLNLQKINFLMRKLLIITLMVFEENKIENANLK